MKCKSCNAELVASLGISRGGTDLLFIACPKHGVVAKYKMREYNVELWPPNDVAMVDETAASKEWKT